MPWLLPSWIETSCLRADAVDFSVDHLWATPQNWKVWEGGFLLSCFGKYSQLRSRDMIYKKVTSNSMLLDLESEKNAVSFVRKHTLLQVEWLFVLTSTLLHLLNSISCKKEKMAKKSRSPSHESSTPSSSGSCSRLRHFELWHECCNSSEVSRREHLL